VINTGRTLLLAGFLSLAVACRVGSVSINEETLRSRGDVFSVHRPVRATPAPTQVAYQRTTYDVCPNYFPALALLKKKLGSSTSDPAQCAPSPDPKVQRCQRSLRGCNACAMLIDGSGPGLDWARAKCDGEYNHVTVTIHVCSALCSTGPPEDLASTLLHETIHRCQREGHGEVENECQAYQAEEACLGTPFSREASVCFPIP
jgi:hypothetical protein